MTINWLAGDDAIILSPEEARAFEVFRAAEHTDYVRLARQAGYDPARFFEHGNWQGMDLRDSDLTGVSFKSADLTEVCLYRDQYNAIRQTKPRSLDRARVQESREGGKGTRFTIEFDIARDQAQARKDFEAVLKDQVSRTERSEIEKIDWALITGYLRRLAPPFSRIWALDEILNSVTTQLPNSVYELCRPFRLSQALRVVDWSTAIELLHVIGLPDDDTRIAFLQGRAKVRTYLDERVTAKAIEVGSDLTLLAHVLELYQTKGWPLPHIVQGVAALKLVRTMDGVREFLALMTKVGINPDSDALNTLVLRAQSMDGVRDFLAHIRTANVQPDIKIFKNLARQAQTIADVRTFLNLMANAKVKPDLAIFHTLASQAGSLTAVGDFLGLMAKAQVKPDTTIFRKLARCAHTVVLVRTFIDLMENAGVTPSAAVFSKLDPSFKSMNEVQDFIALMAEYSVKPDNHQLQKFIASGRRVRDVRPFIRDLSAANEKPRVETLNRLMQNTSSLVEAEEVWSLFISLGLKPDHDTWFMLIEKATNWAEAWNIYTSRTPAKAANKLIVLNALLKKSESRQDAHVTLKEYDRHRVVLEENSVYSVVNSQLTDADVLWVLRKMKEMGFDFQTISSRSGPEGVARFKSLKNRI